jgi:heat shock protein HslJ
MTVARIRFHLAASLLLVALVACAKSEPSASGANPAALTGVSWQLDAASMKTLAAQAPQNVTILIEFADGQVSGQSGCNTYGGSYTADSDGSMTFGQFHSTLMACEPDLAALEQAYLQALGQVTTFSVLDTLTLSGDGPTLTFAKAPATQSAPLVGTDWDLTAIVNGDSVSSVIARTHATLTLADDGTASGSGGCNTFHGAYETTGDALTFGPLATTRKLCDEGLMSLEHAYLTALGNTATYAIEGNTLTLLDSSGASLLELTANG